MLIKSIKKHLLKYYCLTHKRHWVEVLCVRALKRVLHLLVRSRHIAVPSPSLPSWSCGTRGVRSRDVTAAHASIPPAPSPSLFFPLIFLFASAAARSQTAPSRTESGAHESKCSDAEHPVKLEQPGRVKTTAPTDLTATARGHEEDPQFRYW